MNLLCTLFSIGCLVLRSLGVGGATLSGAASVHDGDTLYIQPSPSGFGRTSNRQAIRLAGIDAEELDEPNGYAAKAHLILLIRGRPVTCALDGWSYQRRVGTCTAGSDSLNARMVADGYALDCAYYSKGIYATLEPSGVRQRLRSKPYC